jgi:hypothetical protein
MNNVPHKKNLRMQFFRNLSEKFMQRPISKKKKKIGLAEQLE